MPHQLSLNITQQIVECVVTLDGSDLLKVGSVIPIGNTNSELLQGITLTGYNPVTDRIFLLCADYDQSIQPTNSLTFNLNTNIDTTPAGRHPYIVLYRNKPGNGRGSIAIHVDRTKSKVKDTMGGHLNG